MIIQYKNYRLVPEPMAHGKFNIEVTRQLDQGKPGVKNKEKKEIFAFGCTFESCLRNIAEDILAQEKITVDFSQYIDKFRATLAEITKLLK